MSERRRRSVTTTLGAMLQDVFHRASTTVYADRTALYVVELTSRDGFKLAEMVYAKLSGPDPAILRERAQRDGILKPHAVGSAPVEMLARMLEALGPTEAEGTLRAWTMREMFNRGAVPVVMVEEGGAVLSTLAEVVMPGGPTSVEFWGGWTRPIVGEA